MAEEFYWRSKIYTYECKRKISFVCGVFKCYSLKILVNKQFVYHFDFFNLIKILIFLFSEVLLKCTEKKQYVLKVCDLFLHVTYKNDK
jgi:hypothetical protein